MAEPDSGLVRAIQAHTIASTAATVANSLRTRGLRETILLFALGTLVPASAEYLMTSASGILQHNIRPKIRGVPLVILLAWHNVINSTITMTESILDGFSSEHRGRHEYLPLGTATIATSLDLLVDCYGLDNGLWEWNRGGLYASEIEGPNGERGIPALNFYGWISLNMGAAIVYQLFANGGGEGDSGPEKRGSGAGGRSAALILVSYYVLPVAWSFKERKTKYLLYSILFPVAALAALKKRWT